MNDPDDYESDMKRRGPKSIDIEELLAGSSPPSELADLTSALLDLRAEGSRPVPAQLVERIATRAAAHARGTAPGDVTAAAPRRAWASLATWRRRAVTVASAATLLLGGGMGTAVAADGAAPGDLLYGVDRALEAVGIGNGGAAERLQEVSRLVDKGEVAHGLEHAAELLASSARPTQREAGASEALRSAANRVKATQSGESETTRAAVAELLTYLSENIGHVDGQHVADLTRSIGHPGKGLGPVDVPNPLDGGPPGAPHGSGSRAGQP